MIAFNRPGPIAAVLLVVAGLSAWLLPETDMTVLTVGILAPVAMVVGMFRGFEPAWLLCLGEVGAIALGLAAPVLGVVGQVFLLVWLAAETPGQSPVVLAIPLLAGLGTAIFVAWGHVLYGLLLLAGVVGAGIISIAGIERWVRRRVGAI